MTPSPLQPTPFRGDPDVAELHAFFQPERQFAGDTLWTFGTSLKSAYVNSFEFLNHPPLVQLWRDGDHALRAVSRIMLGTGEWFYLADLDYRRTDVTAAIIRQADSALQLLSAHPSWRTVRYESDRTGRNLLEDHGYAADGYKDVYMTQSLDETAPAAPEPPGIGIRILDPDDSAQVVERGDAQTDAFGEDQQGAEVAAWMSRTMPHQLGYGGRGSAAMRNASVVARDADGTVLSFADPFFDHANKIGEFEPVGTRKKMQRRGLATAVLARGLALMREVGMQRAVVRTGSDNTAAIAAYESVGFEVTDRLMNFRKLRS